MLKYTLWIPHCCIEWFSLRIQKLIKAETGFLTLWVAYAYISVERARDGEKNKTFDSTKTQICKYFYYYYYYFLYKGHTISSHQYRNKKVNAWS